MPLGPQPQASSRLFLSPTWNRELGSPPEHLIPFFQDSTSALGFSLTPGDPSSPAPAPHLLDSAGSFVISLHALGPDVPSARPGLG